MEKWKRSFEACSSRRPRRRYIKISVIMTFPSFHDPSHLFFITASIIDWKHLFISHEYALIPLNSLAWMQRQNRILVFAYVIMPSHLHVILKPVTGTIAEILQQFGSFTSHEILKKLREQGKRTYFLSFIKIDVIEDTSIVFGRIFRQRIFTH